MKGKVKMKYPISLTVVPLLLAVSNLSAATLYVSLESTNPTPPYATWDTAATNIQQAVAAGAGGDRIVVTNGMYAGRVTVTNTLVLMSVNGPQFTIINGGATNKCASLADGASLSGFTLTNGIVGVSCASTNALLTNCVIVGNRGTCISGGGAGAIGGTLYNCTLTKNSISQCVAQGGGGGGAAYSTLYSCTLSGNSARSAGAAASCTLYNCTLSGNFATLYGGGAIDCTLYNCTLSGNYCTNGGGGAAYCTLYNCVVYSNTAPDAANYDSHSTLNYCCTTPLPTNGVGSITNPPLFVDYASANLRLESNSPCINSGNNAYVGTTTDLDGNPRIVSGTVDIGAYEFQGPGSVISYAWLQQYSLPTDGTADYADPDGDRMNNWQEWICGTDPTNSLSVLTMLTPSNGPSRITVPWQSVIGKTYFLERSTNLDSPFASLATNTTGQAGTTSYTDTNAPGADPFFYRVGVQH